MRAAAYAAAAALAGAPGERILRTAHSSSPRNTAHATPSAIVLSGAL